MQISSPKNKKYIILKANIYIQTVVFAAYRKAIKGSKKRPKYILQKAR
jgi:hypothetical protein